MVVGAVVATGAGAELVVAPSPEHAAARSETTKKTKNKLAWRIVFPLGCYRFRTLHIYANLRSLPSAHNGTYGLPVKRT